MTGRRYYFSTLTAWQRHAPRCAETHFVALDSAQNETAAKPAAPDNTTLVFALITPDEAAHIALENDSQVEPLPHALARIPVSERVAEVLAPYGFTFVCLSLVGSHLV
jgi:hypothetical protein